MFDRAIIGAKKATNRFTGMVKPDVVVKKAVKDAKRRKDMSVFGLFVKYTHVLSKIVPQRMVMKLWVSMQKLK